MTTKESNDNNNFNSEFNPAYSFELKTNPTQGEVDTFDHILEVTSHHEAVYAYYYMDDNNKVRRILTINSFNSSNILILFAGQIHQDCRFNN